MTRLFRQNFNIPFTFPVLFTRDVVSPDNPGLAEVLAQAGPGPHRLALVLDQGVNRAFPEFAENFAHYLQRQGGWLDLAAPALVVPGGEAAKAGFAVVNQVLELIERQGLCRQSFLLVVGGGAVLDAAGFAASMAHRGVRLIRLPSTVLAQNDAGVGVKNGVNWSGRKNFLGAFAPPFAVINDFSLLRGLSVRDRRSGLSEAVKVALIRDREFFLRLRALRHRLGALEPAALEEAIERCAVLHLEHIASSGDPFEQGSSRPLDFGHWSAHALEELSGFRLSHGEAVAIGVALDSVYSWLAGLMPENDLNDVIEVLSDLGFSLWHPALDSLDVGSALEAFRQHLGGRLLISLIAGPGARLEVDGLDAGVMGRARDWLAATQGGGAQWT